MKHFAIGGTLFLAAMTLGLAGCSSDSNPLAPAAPPPPTAQADSFTLAANLPGVTIPAAIGVLTNDPAGSTVIASDAQSTLGGTVTVNPDGSFTFEPAAGVTGTDTFNYSVDAGGNVSSATVTVDIAHKVVFVDPAAAPGGDGHYATPFDTLAAGLGAGDTVYVYAGDGGPLNGGATVTLLPGQKLIGESSGLSVEVKDGEWVEVVAPSVVDPLDPAPPAIYPRIATAINTDVGHAVIMADGSEVSGFDLQATGVINDPIDGPLGLATIMVDGVTDFAIRNNVITSPGGPGIELIDVNGKGVIADNAITDFGGDHGAIDFLFRAAQSTVDVTITGNQITTAQDVLAAAIGVEARDLPHQIKMVIDGNELKGGRAADPLDPVGHPAMPDVTMRARTSASMCVELTNNTTDAAGVFEAVGVAPGTFQLAAEGNIGATVEAVGTTPVPIGSCQ